MQVSPARTQVLPGTRRQHPYSECSSDIQTSQGESAKKGQGEKGEEAEATRTGEGVVANSGPKNVHSAIKQAMLEKGEAATSLLVSWISRESAPALLVQAHKDIVLAQQIVQLPQ
jgi:hypothetical protein